MAEKQAILDVQPEESCREMLNITGFRIRHIIQKRPKLKRSGIDKL